MNESNDRRGGGILSYRRLLWLLVAVALVLRWPVPEPAWSHFDESSFIVLPLGFWGGDLDPHFFNYPTFHFYLSSLAYFLYYAVGWSVGVFGTVQAFVAERYFVDGTDLLSVARGLNTLLSALTVLTAGLLGRRLRGPAFGLLTAGFLAVMPLSVRFAHLANTDTPAVLWIVAALLWAVRARQQGERADFVMAGVFAGLAAATKYPAGLVAVPVAVAWLSGHGGVGRRRVALGAAAALTTFAVATPFVWLSPAAFWGDFTAMSQTHLLAPAAGTSTPVHLAVTLRFAVGWLGVGALVAGLVVTGRRRGWQQAMIVAGLLAFAAPLLVAKSTFMRYALPLTPLLALLLAQGVTLLAQRRRWLTALAVPLLVAEPLYASVATRSLLSGEDTREQAKRWILQQAPRGGRLVESDSECGRIGLLTPQKVFVHQAHYLRSYDVEALLQAYRHLARHPDLPPLFLGRGQLGPSATASAAPSHGQESALWLRYRHQVCPEPAMVLKRPTERVFSPGAESEARFDDADWYFLPVAGFRHLEATGPVIEMGLLGVPGTGAEQPLSAAGFFQAMAWVLEAQQAAGDGREQVALQLYGRMLVAWPRPEAVVGPQMAGRLLTQIGKLSLNRGRAAEAIQHLERAVALQPNSAETVNVLAVACASAGQLQRASDLWRQLIEADPGFGSAYRNLARALTRLGRVEEAREVERMGREFGRKQL